MQGVELGFIKWAERVTENLTFIWLNRKEKREITEKDYELLRMMHRLWFCGEFPIYAHENSFVNKAEKVTEQGLFDMSESNGTEVESGAEDKT